MASRQLLEASTPEEAKALAQARYGPNAAVDVTETRSGGVMGFFASQRYVAALTSDDAVGNSHVSTSTVTVPRDQDADLDSAIAEASQALGSPRMSGPPPRPSYSVAAGPAPSDESSALQGSSPSSPFAAALSRVTAEPVVTEAVMNALDQSEGTSGTRTQGAGAVHATMPAADVDHAVLYSIPQVARTVDDATTVTPLGSPASHPSPVSHYEDLGAVPQQVVDDPTRHVNYAAALMSNGAQHPYFPQPPAPQPPAPQPPAPQPPAPVAAQHPYFPQPTAPQPPSPVAAPVTAPAPVEQGTATHTHVATAMAAAIPHTSDPTGLLPRLDATGFPFHLIPDLFLHEVGEKGIHTALTRLIKMRTAPAPALPVAPCTVVFVGPGTEALTAAMGACAALRADASQVAWVGPAHLSNLVPAARRISTPQAATDWLAAPKRASVVNVIAIHVPVSENIDPHTRAVIAALNPTMVLAVVEATRKSEAVTRWIEALDCVDAVALENASDTHDPATWLTLPAAPVALVEGRKATAARWASLLCERLTDMEA